MTNCDTSRAATPPTKEPRVPVHLGGNQSRSALLRERKYFFFAANRTTIHRSSSSSPDFCIDYIFPALLLHILLIHIHEFVQVAF